MKQDESKICPQQITENITDALNLYIQAAGCVINDNNSNQSIKMDPFNVTQTFLKAYHEVWSNPQQAAQNSLELANNYMKICNNVTQRFLGQEIAPLYSSSSEWKDNRFKDESWEANPAFDFIKQSYHMNSLWVQDITKQIETLDEKDSQKLEFYTKLIMDAIAPTNFVFTNPEVIKETLSTNGANLVKGAQNFLHDAQNSKGSFKITTADLDSFKVGKNLATTQGKVVFKNDLMELIMYEPQTEKVYKTPIVITPAWINKYYILDLSEKNSFAKWITEQGFTTFMISWVNPNEKLGHKSFDDYMNEGPLEAIKQVKKITGEDQSHFMGYCLGGTLISATVAYLRKTLGKSIPVKTATFLTSLVDFSDAGDLGVFIDDEQISMLEQRMSEKGYLEGEQMAQTFSMIRANDMIWSFYINNYLMGKDPFPFDILYWNSDSTRLPSTMHSFYLRKMYQKNLLAKKNGLELNGTKIDLSLVDIPVYILSTKEDHITPWESTYTATKLYGKDTKFVLSGSGHVAGVINPPAKR